MDQPVMTCSTDVVRALHVEIESITSQKLRDLADVILDAAPGSFWLAPASSSGKHHPPDEREPGGTVLHTARVMRLARELGRMVGLDGRSLDLLSIAALLHDLYKGGEGDTPCEHTWPLHQVAPRFLMGGDKGVVTQYVREHGILSEEELEKVWRAVEAHEGRWSHLTAARSFDYAQELGLLLHVADYIASRNFVRVEVA